MCPVKGCQYLNFSCNRVLPKKTYLMKKLPILKIEEKMAVFKNYHQNEFSTMGMDIKLKTSKFYHVHFLINLKIEGVILSS